MVILSFGISGARAFTLYRDDTTGTPCKLSNPMQITYYNVNYTADPYALSLAAEVWNDVPAFIHISSTSNQNAATVLVLQTSNPLDLGTLARTWNSPSKTFSCPGGIISTPLYIQINTAAVADYLNTNPPSTKLNVDIHVLAHELGHVLGLPAQLQVPCAIEYFYIDISEQCGVDFPVADDIKGVSALYGWAGDTRFAGSADANGFSIDFSGSGGFQCQPCEPPVTLLNTLAGTNYHAEVLNNTSLPLSNVALMMGYVTPNTVYRFHMGWLNGLAAPATDTGARFATIELDSDAIRFVSSFAGTQTMSATGAVSGTSYFVELAIEVDNSKNQVHADGYVFQGSMQSGNGTETFIGHWGGYLTGSCGLGCTNTAKWSQAGTMDSAVWTDSSSNPKSNYRLDHFWNLQSNPNKLLPRGPLINEFSTPSSVSTGVQTYASYSVSSRGDFISIVKVNWGDGFLSSQSYSNLTPYVPPGTLENGTLTHVYLNAGTYTVTLIVLDSLNQQTTKSLTVNVSDFSVSASSPAPANAGSSATSTITIAYLNGFTGTVALTDTVSSGLTCGAITPGSVSGSATASVSCSATVAGNYGLTITGTSGSLTHSVTVVFSFVDFSVSASPSPMGVPKGSSGSSTITVSGSNGFMGSVSVSASVPSGLTASFSASSVMLNPGVASNSTVLTVSAGSSTPLGAYTVTVMGTSGSLSHSISIVVNVVGDFSISAPKLSYTMNTRSQVSETVSLSILNSFTGTVSLSAVLTSCPSTCQGGPGSGVSPSVLDTSGGYGTSTLTITSGLGTGTYTITVSGTCSSGDCSTPAQTHSIKITVTVTSNLSPHASNNLANPETLATGSWSLTSLSPGKIGNPTPTSALVLRAWTGIV